MAEHLERLLSPTVREDHEQAHRPPEQGIGLCLSGGGYRAMLFHLGALWRLNEFGYLPKLKRISSVSGGSIIAGVLGLHWSELDFDGDGVSPRFKEVIVEPVRKVAGRTIDVKVVLAGVLLPGSSVAWHLTRDYRRRLFGSATLRDLPDETKPGNPRFVITATNLQSGALWRFAKPYTWDYKVGEIPQPAISLASAVAASSAFPPILAPARFRFKASDYAPKSRESNQGAAVHDAASTR